MAIKRAESFDDNATKRSVSEAIKLAERSAADQNRHTPRTSEDREQLRRALASEGLPLPEGQ